MMNRRAMRGTSPVPNQRYDQMIQNMPNRFVVLQPQVPGQPVPPNQNLQFQNQEPLDIPPPPPPQPAGHPFLRRAGLIGLGAGLGYLGYKYRPLTKLGQKLFNYTTDKFHYLFNPINETNSTDSSNSSNQTTNRNIF